MKEPDIVFVHLNTEIPKYLIANLKRTVRIFPNNRVVLITNKDILDTVLPGVVSFKYVEDEYWNKLMQNLNHPKDFRNNFWMISIARFFAIEQYMNTNNSQVIHVESDVLLSEDFPLNRFAEIEKPLAFPIVSSLRGVASVLFIQDSKSAEKLSKFSISRAESNSDTSDMLILRSYFDIFKEDVFLLPFGPSDLNSFSRDSETRIILANRKNTEYFGGVFDGNDLGVYFFGTNPENSRGISVLRKEIPLNFARTKTWNITYDALRNFINIIDNTREEEIKVFSLHATCKKVKLFDSGSQSSILIRRVSESHFQSKKELDLFAFLNAGSRFILKKFKTIEYR